MHEEFLEKDGDEIEKFIRTVFDAIRTKAIVWI